VDVPISWINTARNPWAFKKCMLISTDDNLSRHVDPTAETSNAER
jgi:hypothetical protein